MALSPIAATGAAALGAAAPVAGPATPPSTPGFGPYMQQAQPDAARISAPGPAVRAVPAQDLAQVQQPATRSVALGKDVLNSLERFGRQVNTLQKLGTDVKHAKPGPAVQVPQPSPASPTAPANAAGDAGTDLSAVFRSSMESQAQLYGLVTEVSLGRSVSGSVSTTMKTLLTQSG